MRCFGHCALQRFVMRDTDYAFCVARLKANERKMLSFDDFKILVYCKDINEAFEYLLQKNYIDKKCGIQELITFQNEKLWQLLSESVPDKKVLDTLCVLNDFFNIKTAVKCFFAQKDAFDYYVKPTTLSIETVTKAISNLDFSSLCSVYADSAKTAYNSVCLTENSASADIIIDKATICALKSYADGKNGLAGEISAFLCDIANIKIALRCKSANKSDDFIDSAVGDCVYIDRNKLLKFAQNDSDELGNYLLKTRYKDGIIAYNENFALFDKWCDDKIIALCKKAKFTCFGFDPVCAYYYAKRAEIKTLRIILSGLQMGTDKDALLKLVRMSYV